MVTHVLESMNEVITNNYDQGHKAIDIVASDRSETNIIALENGTVETVINNVKHTNHNSRGLATYGNFVKVKQTDGKTALYAHIKYGTIKVKKGQEIQKGDVIGTIGDTGNAYGKHLHLEIKNKNNIKEDPLISLNKTVEKKDTPINTDKKTNTKETNTYKPTTTKTTTKQSTIKKEVNTSDTYLNASHYHYGSIVDGLKSVGVDSSYNYRKQLAKHNGIQNYRGSYSQNLKMLNLLKNGKLKKV